MHRPKIVKIIGLNSPPSFGVSQENLVLEGEMKKKVIS